MSEFCTDDIPEQEVLRFLGCVWMNKVEKLKEIIRDHPKIINKVFRLIEMYAT